MFLCLIKFISKYSEGQGQQNPARAGPDRPVDSLDLKAVIFFAQIHNIP